MLSRPHGGRLIQRTSHSPEWDRLLDEVERLPRLDISPEIASDVWNLGIGAFSPLEGFMGSEDFRATLHERRLREGVPWTIPIVLDVSAEQANRLARDVGLWYAGQPLALLSGISPYGYDRREYAEQVSGTDDRKHPGVAHVVDLGAVLLGGPLRSWAMSKPPSPAIVLHLARRASCSQPKAGARWQAFRRATCRIWDTNMCRRRP